MRNARIFVTVFKHAIKNVTFVTEGSVLDMTKVFPKRYTSYSDLISQCLDVAQANGFSVKYYEEFSLIWHEVYIMDFSNVEQGFVKYSG